MNPSHSDNPATARRRWLSPSAVFRPRIQEIAKKVWHGLRGLFWTFLVLVLVAALMESVGPWVGDQYQDWSEGDPYLKVWVNPEVRAYYGPGDKAYGNTIPGFHLSQADARNAGYRSTNPWGVGYGRSARPLRTKTQLEPFAQSRLSWGDGSLSLYLDNKSDWEITEVTIWISKESGPRKTYRLTGHAMPKSEVVFQISGADSPEGKKWQWGFSKVKGFPQ